MNEAQVRIGFDRYLALDWANYALNLYLSSQDPISNYELLKGYLQGEIKGIESARKTANQLKRLWLNTRDENQSLREKAASIIHPSYFDNFRIFHYGMALNVFPIFRETCQKIGEIAAVQSNFTNKMIIDRVSRNYLNPSSTPRLVMRVIQTLVGWGYISSSKDVLQQTVTHIFDDVTAEWFILALMCAMQKHEISISHLTDAPDKLGVVIPDVRRIIQSSEKFSIRRGNNGEEIVSSM